ncbi:MAG: ribonuclease HII, partial [Lachnospiraceae bacterium]|nr:ribonuclease HII [Lachnospiraceae bacterium]
MAESIQEIKKNLQAADYMKLPELLSVYEKDERSGVIQAVKAAKKRLDAYFIEIERSEKLKFYEKKYDAYSYICGIDEVGRGPLAGPVVAGAVIFPKNCDILYINDSKKLSEKKREELYDVIMDKAVAVGIGYNTPERIDEINILQATYEACRLYTYDAADDLIGVDLGGR